MKLVHAVWEQRNMGVDCWEVTIDKTDTLKVIKQLSEQEDLSKADYVVLKLPAELSFFMQDIQEEGWLFVETLTTCYHEAKMPALTRIQTKMYECVSYDIMSQNDIKILFSEIDKGIFKTDRIAMDRAFTDRQAYARYKGWIKEETDKGASLYKVMYKEKTVGFFGFKKIEKDIYFPYLGGLYEEAMDSGIGFTINCCEIAETIRRGGKRMLSAYSSNNRGASAIHLYLGYVLDEISYVYVKHNH